MEHRTWKSQAMMQLNLLDINQQILGPVNLFSLLDCSLEFSLSILSHHGKSSAAEVVPYYWLSPKTLERVTVVLGAPGTLGQAVVQRNSRKDPNCSVEELG